MLKGLFVWIANIYAVFGMVLSCHAAITITEIQALSFVPVLSGTTIDVVTLPTDSRAAIFNITGTPNLAVTATVVETSIDIVRPVGNPNAAGNKMTVTNWTYGGAVAADGTAFMDATGELNNVRIGATVQVRANDIAGDFSGTATFRLVYL